MKQLTHSGLGHHTTHPNFIIGIVSLLLLFVGLAFYANGSIAGYHIWYVAMALGFIHWIWSIADVFKNQTLASQSRVMWMILVVIVPPAGGLLYYAFSRTVRM